MKTKLILAILLLAGCKKEETPTPQPETPAVVYYIQFAPEKSAINAPYPVIYYYTDTLHKLYPGQPADSVVRFEVKGFTDSIEVEMTGKPYGAYEVSFLKGDSTLARDSIDETNYKTKRLKWPS